MIVPMKKARIAILSEDRERLMASLQKSGCLMFLKSSEDAVVEDPTREEALLARTEKSLKLLKKYTVKHPASTGSVTVSEADFITEDPATVRLLQDIEAADEEIFRLQGENQTLQTEILSLLPWETLETAPTELGKNRSVVLHVGFIAPAKSPEFEAEAIQLGTEISFYGTGPEGIAVVIAIMQDEDIRSIEVLRTLGFVETSLPPVAMTVAAIIAKKRQELADHRERISAAEDRLTAFAIRKAELELLNDQTATLGERKKAPVRPTATAVFIEGWVRSDQTGKLEKAIAAATDISDLELTDPEKGEQPPTAVKNNKFVSAFETITDMFAKPSPNEIDPNPVMSIWYALIFGMMMADVGYGAVMIVLFAFMIKKMRAKGETRKLLKVLMYSGITTMFWGVMFGSYFGFSWHPIVLDPMVDTVSFLILSIVLGVLHIFTGLLMRAANNIKKKDYLAAFTDSFSWIFLILGLGMLFVPAYAAVGKWLALSGAAIVVLFAGRASKNIFARLGSGLYALYGATGFLGDIMSYTRILALSLSTVVIGFVMNLLAGMIQGSLLGIFLSIFVYIIGHVFNMAMGLLSAYVHTSRLQFIEFYTKFYEGTGYEFRPLGYQLNYIEQVSDLK
ncbi:MAG: V-type ATP synthase subunit I [bacterium]